MDSPPRARAREGRGRGSLFDVRAHGGRGGREGRGWGPDLPGPPGRQAGLVGRGLALASPGARADAGAAGPPGRLDQGRRPTSNRHRAATVRRAVGTGGVVAQGRHIAPCGPVWRFPGGARGRWGAPIPGAGGLVDRPRPGSVCGQSAKGHGFPPFLGAAQLLARADLAQICAKSQTFAARA